MDIVGTAGAIVGIIGVITRTLSALADIGRRFRGARTTVKLLSGQLVAVRTALNQIYAFMNDDLLTDEPHYQLILDLDDVVECCELLVGMLDDQISKLELDGEDHIKLSSKIKLALEDQGTKECLTRLHWQVSALTLILTAFRCREATQQQILLNQPRSRKAIERIRDDSSSLMVLYDSQSFLSVRNDTTDRASKLSANFPFDEELLQHKAYRNSFRSLMRRNCITEPESTTTQRLGAGSLGRLRSRIASIENDPASPEVFTLIGYDYGLEQLLWTSKPAAYPRFSLRDRAAACDHIQQAVILGLIRDREAIEQAHVHLPGSKKSGQLRFPGGAGRLDNQVVEAVKYCASSGCGRTGSHWSSPLSYFLCHVDRVLHSDYCPTSYDLMVWRSQTCPEKQEIALRDKVKHGLHASPAIRVILGGAKGQPGASYAASTMNVSPHIALCTSDTRLFTDSVKDKSGDVMLTCYIGQLGDSIKNQMRPPRDIILLFTNVAITMQRLKTLRRDGCQHCNEMCKTTFTQMIANVCKNVRGFMDFEVFKDYEEGQLNVQELAGNELDYPQLFNALKYILIQMGLREHVL